LNLTAEPDCLLLERIAAANPDLVIVYDLAADSLPYCSERAAEVLGYSPAQLQALHTRRAGWLCHPGDLQALDQWFAAFRATDGNAVRELTYRARHADGSWRWLHIRGSVFDSEAGGVTRIIASLRDVGAHRAEMEALRTSEARQRHSLAAGEIGAWELDLATGKIWRTLRHDQIFGYQDGTPEWNSDIFMGHVCPEDRERVSASYRDARTSLGPWKAEFRILRADGVVRWVAVQSCTTRDAAGNPARMHGTVADVTVQLKTRESLQQQTGILRMVLNAMSEGVVVCDRDGDIMLINKSARQMLNIGNDSLNVRQMSVSYDWYLPDGVTQYTYEQRPLVRALNGEKVTDFEGHIRSPERGVDLIVNSSSAPLRDGDGQVVGAVHVFRDVTAGKRALQDLRNAEQHFKLLVEGTTDYAIFMLDKDGMIVSWNPGAQRILGYQQTEALGRHISIFYTKEDVSKGEPQRILTQAVKEGRVEEDNWRVRRDGQRFWSTGVVDALHDDKGVVRGFVKIMRDNTERRLAEENTYHLANHDSLTGLANRTRFLERLHEALLYADRDDTQVAVLLLDLDRFKMINDTLGHHVGDMLLKKVAFRLLKCIRETDTVARLGGDEFVVILTHLKELDGLEPLAAKIVNEMSRPYYVNRQEVRSGASIGVAVYRRDGQDPGELLQKADLAMYRAKSAGRNNYRIFAKDMLTEVQIRREQEDSLRHALEYHEFELAFQPQVDLDTLRLSGAEVLLRSRNRVLQNMPTSSVIALAEETGLIVPLGEWVLQNACRQIKKWQKMGLPEFKVAVNFSPTHLLAPNFLQTVQSALSESGLDARYLELEVTESLLVAASEANNEIMNSLKQIGISISVDDFGTGFSALSYLKHFPVDVLKLDGSLVRNLPGDRDDVAIVSAIIKLALDLNIKVIAEGVETVAQMSHLQNTHCNTAQGFFFSPPIRTEKFEALLQDSKWWGPVLH
jgi:diguanylate cyclase (GGDEF)-like protein/PAS domain S-box-containing protein